MSHHQTRTSAQVFRRQLDDIAAGLAKRGFDPVVCENLVYEHFTRLHHREAELEDPATLSKWRLRLETAVAWWSENRGAYTHQLANHYGNDEAGRAREISRVTDCFRAMMRGAGGGFFIYSGGSGGGKSTMWERLTSTYPRQFAKFLLYTSRDRRRSEEPGLQHDIPPGCDLHAALLAVLKGDVPPSAEEAIADRGILLPAGLRTIFASAVQLEALGDHGLARSREGGMRPISMAERLSEMPDGSLRVYGEFDGVQYWFAGERQLRDLQAAGAVEIVENSGMLQAFSPKDIEAALQTENAITVLEAGPPIAALIRGSFAREITSVFVSPDGEDALRTPRGAGVWRYERRLEWER